MSSSFSGEGVAGGVVFCVLLMPVFPFDSIHLSVEHYWNYPHNDFCSFAYDSPPRYVRRLLLRLLPQPSPRSAPPVRLVKRRSGLRGLYAGGAPVCVPVGPLPCVSLLWCA